MRCDSIFYSEHAIVQMAARNITPAEVEAVLQEGEIIKHYPDDQPSPSWLILGYSKGKAVHVVFSRDIATDFCIIITAYYPDPTVWNPDFKTKKYSA
ncbi:MAG: DUF4258 domain-containing protein [Saprospiraceae bacterium]|nr:DUF4258 domain-containing protein [Saprospiraceae bacterium]